MADETFRQERKGEPVPDSVKAREARSGDNLDNPAMKITGRVPPAMKQALQMVRGQRQQRKEKEGLSQARAQGSAQLEDLIEGLRSKAHVYDEVVLPSRGNFYDGKDGPTDGVLHIRAMTGEEEQILATPRYVRKGQAINMIFQRCLQESIKSDDLLSVDRTFLLIWLRGISYSPEYEVEVKCPECDRKFQTTINLNSLVVNDCPTDFRPPLSDVLPVSGYKFNYRLSRGKDEQALQDYRDRQLKMWGDSGADDTLIYRTALLLDDIEGLRDKHELQMLLKKLPIQDVSFLRNTITDPPFGIDTKCAITCASCLADFDVDLPLEANFFFPRQRPKKEEQQA
jgi:hypothetical protein